MVSGSTDGMQQATALQSSKLVQSGVAQTTFDGANLSLREITGAALIRVHTLAPPEVTAAALMTCGFPASTIPNTSAGTERMAMCLRPGEWLLFSEQAAGDGLLQSVRAVLDPATSSVFAQSDGLACFRLMGAGAPWLLSKLSALDYLGGGPAGVSGGQHCARTRLAQVTVLVNYHPVHGDDSANAPVVASAEALAGTWVYDLIFDRSIAEYLWRLLLRNAPHADELAQHRELHR